MNGNKNTGDLASEIGKKHPFESAEQEAYLNLSRTHALLGSQLNKFLKEQGITSAQYNVLRILAGHGKAVSVYEIAAELISPQPDIPRLIERLETNGLVSKCRCEKDRRVMWVTLTDKGAAIAEQLAAPLVELHEQQLRHMTGEELSQLSRLLWLARNPKRDATSSDTP